MSKYKNADAIIVIEEKEYALYKKGHGVLSSQPHMVDIASGTIPKGNQRFLLGLYLLQHGVNPADLGQNTHTHIRQATAIAAP